MGQEAIDEISNKLKIFARRKISPFRIWQKRPE
jgi:hypothetical protein